MLVSRIAWINNFTDVKFDGFVCFRTVKRLELTEAIIWFDKLPMHFRISKSIGSVETFDTGENVSVLLDGQDPSKSHALI